ncbi:carbon storage regulator [Clostridium sp. MB40-C1]|uniref:carbon storage regulator n=1 Tax=Clostridium sp. MB40-C1 TaxID=3070996 RepID=UPI0027DEF0E9|nr:carbon storage regulator [Clostridium sp. MB40-C1]WMJ79598.1 carbon storage regulator [Clostridium sp. MB40-C1]
MLVLGVRTGESIVIDGNIKLTFVKVKENTVRVMIDAPKEVPILRDGVEDKNKSLKNKVNISIREEVGA